MRCKTVTLAGIEYPLRFSLRAVKACGEKYGSLEKMFEAIQRRGGGTLEVVDDCLWLLGVMLDAGYRYNLANGQSALEPPPEDLLLDTLDLAEMQVALLSAIAGDSERTVEAEPPKNGDGAEAAGRSS